MYFDSPLCSYVYITVNGEAVGSGSSTTPGNFSGFSANGQNDNSTEYILLGASAAILLIGIITAALFKRRK